MCSFCGNHRNGKWPFVELLIVFFNWNVIALQRCVSFCCTMWISYMYTYMPSFFGFTSHLGHHRALSKVQYFFFFYLIFWLCIMWGLSSLTRDWTHVPCVGRQILIHCTTREVPKTKLSDSLGAWGHSKDRAGRGEILGSDFLPKMLAKVLQNGVKELGDPVNKWRDGV